MTLDEIQDVLMEIKGCTFATIDTETEPSPGIKKLVTGERVLLFTNQRFSGYDAMVRRRLEEAGKDPDSFVLGELPWGERIPVSPLIKHEKRLDTDYYIQTVILNDGEVRAFIGRNEIKPEDMPDLLLRERDRFVTGLAQGLEPERAVLVRTYDIKNIKRIKVLGQELIASS